MPGLGTYSGTVPAWCHSDFQKPKNLALINFVYHGLGALVSHWYAPRDVAGASGRYDIIGWSHNRT